MVIALSDIGKRKHPERIERRCSFTQAAAPRWRLIEDESKSAVEPTNSNQRRYRSFDVGRTRTHRDQAKIGPRDGAHAQCIVRGGGIDDRKPDPLSFKADERPFCFGGVGAPNSPPLATALPPHPLCNRACCVC